jgi:hypothetical protein
LAGVALDARCVAGGLAPNPSGITAESADDLHKVAIKLYGDHGHLLAAFLASVMGSVKAFGFLDASKSSGESIAKA